MLAMMVVAIQVAALQTTNDRIRVAVDKNNRAVKSVEGKVNVRGVELESRR